uniref:F-box domain-containing protein n=1 Tax=Arundo donax TaxID=35708 RepID=A0A0A8YUZ6_ARUDO
MAKPQICSISTATASQVRLRDPPPPEPLADDDLLTEILIRLPTLADLGRACAVCPAFHRVITSHSFLRRFRALHPPALLGILSDTFIPAQPPHPSAAVARAFADADVADFWCSFIPSPDRWRHRDFRDGRALLSAVPEGSTMGPGGYNPRALARDFAVCDPVHRRYLLLPAIPDDLAALAHQQDIAWFEPFLAPSVEDEGGTSFRVLGPVSNHGGHLHLLFGRWRMACF